MRPPAFAERWMPTPAELAEIEARKAEVRAESIARGPRQLRPDVKQNRHAKKSRFHGVVKRPYGKWQATLPTGGGRLRSLGYFDTEEGAARVREPYARATGARLNFADEAE